MLKGGLRISFSRAASATKGLMVDPGGYKPLIARLSIGLSNDSLSSFHSSRSMPPTK